MYRFGEFRVDVANQELWRDDERLPINRRTFGVLRLLIERAGQIVSKQEFFDTVWADTFVEDNSLTVAITGLRKLLGDTSKDSRLIENLPRRGYRFTGRAEIVDDAIAARTPTHRESYAKGAISRVQSTALGDRNPPAPDAAVAKVQAGSLLSQRKVLLIGGAACLLLLIAALGSSYLGLRDADQIDSIAVLPFENLDSEMEYLSDGLAETIINDIARLPDLRVISRNSTFQYKGKDNDLPTLGQAMNVRAILTGRLVRNGDNIVISTELIDLKTNKHVWGRRYERSIGDILGLQNEISHAVAETLRPTHSSTAPNQLASRQTSSSEAFDRYLRGRYEWNKRNDANTHQAINLFKQAIDIDPAYAMAHLGLANSYLWVHFKDAFSMEERSAMVKAAAANALEIDPNLGEAYATLAINSHFNDWDWKSADANYRKALRYSPNYATAHHWYAEFLATSGRFDESFAAYKRALEIDPLSMAIKSDLGLNYFYARQPENAIKYLKGLSGTDPGFERTFGFLMAIHEVIGNYDDAVTVGDKASAGYGELEIKRKELGERLRRAAKSEGAIGYWRVSLENELGSKSPNLWQIAKAHSHLGQPDKAFDALEKMFAQKSPMLVWLKVTPEVDGLRNDARLTDLIRRVGIPQ